MAETSKVVGVYGGKRHSTRQVYWRCPECGTSIESNCSSLPSNQIESCDFNDQHVTKAPISFEVNWAPNPIGGTLKVDGQELTVTDAFCSLYCGYLKFDFFMLDFDGSCSSIPFGEAEEFSELTGRTISIADKNDVKSEMPIFQFDGSLYFANSLHVTAIEHISEWELLTIAFRLNAQQEDRDRIISVEAQLTAWCEPVTRWNVLLHSGQIPIRFAKKYLPLIGLPVISEGATRQDVISLLGQPQRQIDPTNPFYGRIPDWMVYAFPSFYLRFEMENDVITYVKVMSHESPFAASFPD